MITLSKWQVEILREAFAMLARKEAEKAGALESSPQQNADDHNCRKEEELSFPM